MLTPKTTLTHSAENVPLPEGAPTKDWLERVAVVTEAYVVTVTPKIAAEWLKQNRDNRRFRKAHMRTIATEMARGEWRMTHQGVAFGTSGRLLDGQHRLQAIIESGTTQSLLVFIDAPEQGFANFDRGAQRGISDILLRDPKSISIIGTLARLCVRGAHEQTRKITPIEVQKALEIFAPDLEAMHEASAVNRTGRTLAAIRAAWLVHYHGAGEADKRLLREQWKAFAEYNPRKMDDSTASGDRRLENFKAVRGGAVEIESACIGWLMFDPSRRDLTRVLIRNSYTALDEMRDAARVIMPKLVPSEVKKLRVDADKPKSERWTPMADPKLGPELRAKAMAAIAAKRAENIAG